MADLAIQKKTVTPQQLKAVIRQEIIDGTPEYAPFLGRLQAKYKGNLTDEALVKEYVSAFPDVAKQYDFGGVDVSSGTPAAVAPAPSGSAFRGPNEAPRPLGQLVTDIPKSYGTGPKATVGGVLNTPLLEPARPLLGEASTRIGENIFLVNAMKAQGKKVEPWQEVSVGATQGLTEAGIDLSSPVNVGLMWGIAKLPFAAVASRGKNFATAAKGAKLLMSLYFGGTMSASAIQEFPAAVAAYQAGDYRGAGREATRAAVDALFAIGALKGAKTGIPQAEIDAARLRRGGTGAPPPATGGGAPPPPGAPGASVPPAAAGPPVDPLAEMRSHAEAISKTSGKNGKPVSVTLNRLAERMGKSPDDIRGDFAALLKEGSVDAQHNFVPGKVGGTSAPTPGVPATPVAPSSTSAPDPYVFGERLARIPEVPYGSFRVPPGRLPSGLRPETLPPTPEEFAYKPPAEPASAPTPAAAPPPAAASSAPPPAPTPVVPKATKKGKKASATPKAAAPVAAEPVVSGQPGLQEPPPMNLKGTPEERAASALAWDNYWKAKHAADFENLPDISGISTEPIADIKAGKAGATPAAAPAAPAAPKAAAKAKTSGMAEQISSRLAEFGKGNVGTDYWLSDFINRRLGIKADAPEMTRLLDEAKASVGRGESPEQMQGVLAKVLDEITNWRPWKPESRHLQDPMQDPGIVRPVDATGIPEAQAAQVEAPKVTRFRGTVDGQPSLYYPTEESAVKAGVQDVREVLVEAPVVPPQSESPLSRAEEVFAPAERRYNSAPAASAEGVPPRFPTGASRQAYAEATQFRPRSAPEPMLPLGATPGQELLHNAGYRIRSMSPKIPLPELPSGARDYDIYDLPTQTGAQEVQWNPTTGEWRAYKHYQDRVSLADSGVGENSLKAHLKAVQAKETPLTQKASALEDLTAWWRRVKEATAEVSGRPIPEPEPMSPPDPGKAFVSAFAQSRVASESMRSLAIADAEKTAAKIKEGAQQDHDLAKAKFEESTRATKDKDREALEQAAVALLDRRDASIKAAEKIIAKANEENPPLAPLTDANVEAVEQTVRGRMDLPPGMPPEKLHELYPDRIPYVAPEETKSAPKPRGRTSELTELVQSSPYKIVGSGTKGGYGLVDKATGQEVEANATKIGSSFQVRLTGVRDPIKTVSTANRAHVEMLKAQRQWDLNHGRTWEGMVEAVKEARRAPTPEEAGPLPEFGGAPLPDISGISIPEAKGAPAPVDVSTLPDISKISTKRIPTVPPTLPATVAKAAAAAPKKTSAPKPVVQPKPTAEPVASAPEPGLQPGRTYTSTAGSDELGILSGDRLTYLGREGQVAKFRDADTGSVVRITATEQELMPVLQNEAAPPSAPARENLLTGESGEVNYSRLGEVLRRPLSWADAEKDAIQRAIAFTGGNIKAAAQHLGMGRTSIYRKMAEYGIAAREFLRDESGGIPIPKSWQGGSESAPVPALQPKPTFYSQIERVIDQRMPNAAPVEQVKAIVSGPTSSVKADEYKWSGLQDWLASKTGKVTKQEVRDFLQQNNIRVSEVPKGEISGIEGLKGNPDAAKWSQYTLPGGKNYRELLLQWENPPTVTEAAAKANQVGVLTDALLGRRSTAALDQPGWFTGTHWDEPNVLAHVRFNDRVDSAGKKTLFLEEVQSDWHEQGRERGYDSKEMSAERAAKAAKLHDELTAHEAMRAEEERAIYAQHRAPDIALGAIDNTGRAKLRALRHESNRIRAELAQAERTDVIPAAPFAKTWHELVMKRMLRWAAENGYDKLAWTTGEQQAQRYGLEEVVDNLKIERPGPEGWVVLWGMKDGKENFHQETTEADLPNYVGKEIAGKLLEKGTVEGVDLKVGGSGMKGFYDKILPEFMNKYGKRWGAKVGETEVQGGPDFDARVRDYVGPMSTTERFEGWLRLRRAKWNNKTSEGWSSWNVSMDEQAKGVLHSLKSGLSFKQAMENNGSPDLAKRFGGELIVKNPTKKEKVHAIEITPEMKKSVLYEGQPIAKSEPAPAPMGMPEPVLA